MNKKNKIKMNKKGKISLEKSSFDEFIKLTDKQIKKLDVKNY